MSDRRTQPADRRNEFKYLGLTPEELRRRREETTVEIRKSKREDSLNKRRNLLMSSSQSLGQQLQQHPVAASPGASSLQIGESENDDDGYAFDVSLEFIYHIVDLRELSQHDPRTALE